ncbi:hypothetical protein WICMUC_001848 [Wickerhamomyces mucosus]|uniref:Ran GTPase-activating protein 1 n=1 Tax=Wickerhamomyces mucosus TaxID=1378264 RepID=A0A9P8PRQ2_9ASCO|nr:hypothetical protein WICMUC_001848 [Wickerhamomyces mucosus]
MATLDFIPTYKEEEIYSIANKSIKFDSYDDIKPYLDELVTKASTSTIKKLDFSGNTIGIEASKFLGDVLTKLTSLEEVNFADLFTGRLKDEIPKSLQYLLPPLIPLKKLTILNLSDNAFGLMTIDELEDFLSKAVYLEHLILSNNGMGPFAGARIGKSLYKLSANKKALKLSSLKTFICGRNRLENGSIDYLAIGLRNHIDLQVVKLYQNGIRPQGIAKLILQGLRFNKELTILDLQDNTITRKSALVLADTLSNWLKLKELNVNDCLLNPLGSLKLIESFHQGEILNKFEILRLQYNELDIHALTLLKSVIADKLPNLKTLELNGNRFEEDSSIIDEINEIFEDRGFGELDELDDLEELDSEDEDEEDESEEEAEEEEIELDELEKELEQIQEYYTPDNENKEVEDIATKLEKASI